MKSRRMRRVGVCDLYGEMRNTYKVFVKKSRREHSISETYTWMGNNIKMYVTRKVCEVVGSIKMLKLTVC
jgi:hypothetical protein